MVDITSHRIMLTSVQLEWQTYSNQNQTKPTNQQTIDYLRKSTESQIDFSGCQSDYGFLIFASSKTVWRNVITSWLFHTCWGMSSFISLEIGSFISKLQNVKTFPSALDYLVAGNRFWNPSLTYLPGILVTLSSQSRELTSWDSKLMTTFIISVCFRIF